ncbi:formate dehydrogenase accessory sulfurtransferase FdhD [Corallococcus exercitus]|uniref:Sulfur carrier protein FdhD n=1 Tax=Corallococcus exercitus TaxID=2316736 RepID=A0A3A8HBJ8_9BACT|nr:formate dehydrogenase accessory sulfurtransferase FdhD [Corallococcus exercitus]NOK38798.1 formate dehydrogenase accessory sulfurtransferase FdhD [Corallococcus exercitus]RKG68542.1 formate dehydrogenase accessory sulfurtransferase FdhD [Corallococcus exercitus]
MKPPPALAVIGWSGAGKTTLLERLLPELTSRGLRVAYVKHSSDAHPLHRAGSDTARLDAAGAVTTGFATPDGTQLTTRQPLSPALLARDTDRVDLLLVEGWKDGPLPKLEVWREGLEAPLAASRPGVLAVVTDAPALPPSVASRQRLPVNARAVADFLTAWLRDQSAPRSPRPEPRGVTHRAVRRFDGDTLRETEDDRVAVEEPLEIRVSGDTVATTMRTPGHDRELAVGFLFAEGILTDGADLGSLFHCGHPGEEGYGNVLEVVPAAGAVLDLERVEATRRGTLTTSACGVCGRRDVDDLMATCNPVAPGPVLSARTVARATERLRDIQYAFEHTGGVHAAAALDAHGELLAAHEDVGRHNAVDKVVGALVLAGAVRSPRRLPTPPFPTAPTVLAVSGRASFEIVQKAARARIPVVVSVSAASSLAIDLALRAGVTLAAFSRNGRCNVYTATERLQAHAQTPGIPHDFRHDPSR